MSASPIVGGPRFQTVLEPNAWHRSESLIEPISRFGSMPGGPWGNAEFTIRCILDSFADMFAGEDGLDSVTIWNEMDTVP